MKPGIPLCALLLLAGSSSGWSQAGSAAAGMAQQAEDERMAVPEPLSQNGYSLSPANTASGVNRISGGNTIGVSNDDNVLSSAGNPLSDRDYYISPWLSVAQSRSHTQWSVEYNPTFTVYQRMTALNRSDHNFSGEFEYHVTRYASIHFEDTFTKSSDLSEQLGGGSAPTGLPFLQYTWVSILPVADFMTNRANVEAAYQFGKNDMAGAGFTQLDLRYGNQALAAGLYNSRSRAGQAFYSRRVSSTTYIGSIYRDEGFTAFPGNSETNVQGIFVFYSTSLFRGISLSISSGVEYSGTYQPQFMSTTAPFRTWSPAAEIGLRWQKERRGIAANFAKRVQSGGGLLEAVHATKFDISTRYQLSRLVSMQFAAAYSNNILLDWSAATTGAAGHEFLASVSLERQLQRHLILRIGYGREQQHYAWNSAASRLVTQNRSWLSIAYDFDRRSGGS